VLARSVRNPLIICVGTGFVLVSGTAPVALAGETPSPSADTSASAKSTPKTTPGPTHSTSVDPSTPPTTPPPPPPDPTLTVSFQHAPSSLRQSVSSSFYVEVTPHIPKGSKAPVNVDVTLGGSAGTFVFESNSKHAIAIKSLSYAKLFAVTASVPSKGKVKLWARGDADNTPVYTKTLSLSVKAKPKSTSSNSGGSGSSSSGSSGSSSATTSGSDLPTGSTGSGTTAATGSAGDGAVLPPMTATQAPTTAPPTSVVQNTGNTQSMRGSADEADVLTFDKLASTQAAWLAALLVAFSLLLTQVRLGRANTKDKGPKGAHRRPRRPGSAH
jgi:hypothetical protein